MLDNEGPESVEMANQRPKAGPYQTVKREPEFESVPGKTVMDTVKALLWIPDAAAKILLLLAVVVLGWWAAQEHSRNLGSEKRLGERILALEMQGIRVQEQRSSEMELLKGAIEELRELRREGRNGASRGQGTGSFRVC